MFIQQDILKCKLKTLEGSYPSVKRRLRRKKKKNSNKGSKNASWTEMKAHFHLHSHATSIPFVWSWPSNVSITLHGIWSTGANMFLWVSKLSLNSIILVICLRMTLDVTTLLVPYQINKVQLPLYQTILLKKYHFDILLNTVTKLTLLASVDKDSI